MIQSKKLNCLDPEMFIYGLYAIESHKCDIGSQTELKVDNNNVIVNRQRSLSIGDDTKHLGDLNCLRSKFQTNENSKIYEKNLNKFESMVSNLKNKKYSENLNSSEQLENKMEDNFNRRCSLSCDLSQNRSQKNLDFINKLKANNSKKEQTGLTKKKKLSQRQFSLDLGNEHSEKFNGGMKQNNSLHKSTIIECEIENDLEFNYPVQDTKTTKKWLSKLIDSFNKSNSDA
ncbi:unnamed protein product [Brachionus calyciflorus]|uniref:Uncharacterized protein n=1 Tax=Brachionus calyciflorus TaxID=104777 RepID=A0A814KQA6_9BILA|nr:unnamed protein product [Brachionus calyciflorus]